MKKIIFTLLFCLFIGDTLLATTYYLKAGGTMTVLADWGTNTDGSGTNPGAFSGAHTWNVHNNATVSLNATFTVSGTAIVNIGDGTNPVTFNLISGGQFGTGPVLIGNFPTINVKANAVFVFDRTLMFMYFPTKVNPSSNSTFSFTPNSDLIPSDNYDNVVVATSAINSFYNGNVSVRNLTITPGSTLSIGGVSLTINGTIANTTGVFEGDNFGSGLILKGSGNIGTLRFSTGLEVLSNLTLNMGTSSSYVTLSSDLQIDDQSSFAGALVMTNGGIKLNGYNLTAQSSSAFTGGPASIYGNPGSMVNLNCSSVSGNFNMDATNSSLKALNIYSSGSMSLGSMLNILDSIKIDGASVTTGGNLTLKSTSSLKARVAEISGGGSLSGNITVETFIPGPTTDWAVLGASGVNGLTFNNWYGTIPMAIAGSTTDVTSCMGQYFESVQGWDEAITGGYDTTMTIGTAITPGKGYWLFVGTGLYSTANITTIVNGSPVTGPQSLPLSKSTNTGSCLLANPYPSPISWDRIMALPANSGVTTGAIYIYNADIGTTTSYAGGSSSHANGAKSTIPMGQGFYVEATGSTPLSIDESVKVSNNTSANPLIKAAATTAVGNIVRLRVDGGGYYDETAIRFHSNATFAFDNNLDAHKYFDSPGYVGYPGVWTKRTTISTKSGGEDYSINSLPYALTSNAVIPVLVKVYATGQHTISASDLQNLAPGTCFTLKDKLLNITHDLKASDYVFNISDTTSVPRFELTVCANTAAGINNPAINSENVFVKQDRNGVYVDLNFDKNTKAIISAINILGQEIMATKQVECINNRYYLDLLAKEQIIIVNVITPEKRYTQKIFVPNNN